MYDSKAQALVDFTPLEPGKVGMYVCGPTVQSSPHIGHLRSALAYDIWRRWFSYRGFDVTFVRNVTDIDDKVLVNATEKEPWWAVAYRSNSSSRAGYNALGILPPTYEPRRPRRSRDAGADRRCSSTPVTPTSPTTTRGRVLLGRLMGCLRSAHQPEARRPGRIG